MWFTRSQNEIGREHSCFDICDFTITHYSTGAAIMTTLREKMKQEMKKMKKAELNSEKLMKNKESLAILAVDRFLKSSGLSTLYSEKELSKVKIRDWISERIDENYLKEIESDREIQKEIKMRKRQRNPSK